jgi:hypothetical protein
MDFWADIDRYSFDQVRIVSDVDGDGTDDLLASKYLSWILYDAPSSSGSLSGHASFENWDGTVDSADVDGDGAADLMYGGGYFGGGAHVVYGPVPSGTYALSGGITPNVRPYSVGDLDEDGFDDIGGVDLTADTPKALSAGKVFGLMGSGGF